MSGAANLIQRVASLYEENVTTRARFDHLERQTKEDIADVKERVRRVEEQLHRMELDHVRERAELDARIEKLSGRLDALSEQALHAVAREAARDAMLVLQSSLRQPEAEQRRLESGSG